jgi:hypothetical protein
MFSRRREPTLLELASDRAIRELSNHHIGSEEFMTTLEVVAKLHKMKEEAKPPSVSRDTLAVVAGNLLGIIMIIRHEHVNIIASRAMNLVLKPR